jgi:N-acylneuraminate cytidylyltransferase
MNVAIITARGGSKRIPRKNIREFCGMPIIAYSIQAAGEAGCFDEVMVSTDDTEIADVARRFGAVVPFMRSAATSTDHATTAEVIVEVLRAYEERGRAFALACCIYPTAPFVSAEALNRGRTLLEADSELATVLPVTRFSFPVQRGVWVRGGRLVPIQPEHMLTRSQDLEPAYHDAGQFYWVRVEDFLRERALVTPRTAAVLLPESQVQDIDTEEDWSLAEMKFRLMRGRVAPAATR